MLLFRFDEPCYQSAARGASPGWATVWKNDLKMFVQGLGVIDFIFFKLSGLGQGQYGQQHDRLVRADMFA